MNHRYNPGDTVRLNRASPYRNAAGGTYEVIRQLPFNEGDYQYRIKSSREQHQRVAKERDLDQSSLEAMTFKQAVTFNNASGM